jgi:hypothetical protein
MGWQAAITTAVVRMAQALSVEVAEGVETESQSDLLAGARMQVRAAIPLSQGAQS